MTIELRLVGGQVIQGEAESVPVVRAKLAEGVWLRSKATGNRMHVAADMTLDVSRLVGRPCVIVHLEREMGEGRKRSAVTVSGDEAARVLRVERGKLRAHLEAAGRTCDGAWRGGAWGARADARVRFASGKPVAPAVPRWGSTF